MSDCEDSDFRHECNGEEDSDCESVFLGNRDSVNLEPPAIFSSDRQERFGVGEVASSEERRFAGRGEANSEEDMDSGVESELELDSTESEYIPPSLNTVPGFEPFETPFELHLASSCVPARINMKSPLFFCKPFVTDDLYETFAKNTNEYAASKNTGGIPKPRSAGKRLLPWVPQTKHLGNQRLRKN